MQVRFTPPTMQIACDVTHKHVRKWSGSEAYRARAHLSPEKWKYANQAQKKKLPSGDW